jgi:hypothetical protein
MNLPDDLIPLKDAVTLSRTCLVTLYRWCQRGKLPSYERLGRLFVSRGDVLALFRPRAVAEPVSLPPSPVAVESRRRFTERVLREAGF